MIDTLEILLVDPEGSFDAAAYPEIDSVIPSLPNHCTFFQPDKPLHPIHNKIYISSLSRPYIRRCLIAIRYDISHHQRILTREDTEMFVNDPIEE